MKRQRLGWLGPVIAGIGVAAAAVAAWFMVHERPTPGAVIDTLAMDDAHSIVVRAEHGGDRAFIELREGDHVKWQALVPPYGGRPGAPGIAWSPIAVTVRVIRDGHAELFAFALRDASKLSGMRLATNHGPVKTDATGPVTLTDHERSYEIVSGPDWHQLVAFDLLTGKAAWVQELGSTPVRAGGVENGAVWIDQGGAIARFAARTGTSSPQASKKSPDLKSKTL